MKSLIERPEIDALMKQEQSNPESKPKEEEKKDVEMGSAVPVQEEEKKGELAAETQPTQASTQEPTQVSE